MNRVKRSVAHYSDLSSDSSDLNIVHVMSCEPSLVQKEMFASSTGTSNFSEIFSNSE